MGEERHRYSWLTYQQCCAWLVFGNRMSEGQVSSSIDIFLGLFGWQGAIFLSVQIFNPHLFWCDPSTFY